MKGVFMYNITEITNKDLKFVPLKDWKWKPKSNLDFSKKDIKAFGRVFTSRQIGIQTFHGQSY
tara:strand:+ start:25 stop:213 length:189 start_codon:yes stop_codon:yes gene_type:complete